MLFLFAVILAFGFTYLCHKKIKKYAAVFYIIAILLSAYISIADFKDLPFWFNTYIIELFQRGTFATALWCVVMWTGAFPNGSKAIKAFMPIRGEISILAALLTLGHNIGYGKMYFVWLLTDIERMSKNQIIAAVLTIAMLAIMIPLTVISFPRIRRKISPKRWKKIQRFAYLFYGMIYLHVMVLCVPLAQNGREGYLLRVFVYSFVFIGYGVCRIRKWILLRKKDAEKKVWNVIGASVFVLFIGIITVFAEPERIQAESDTETKTEKLQFSEEEIDSNQEIKSNQEVDSNQEITTIYKDGIYTASAYGYDGDIEITITIQDHKITEIKGLSYESDSWYYETAKKSLFAQILSKQNSEVDVVSGATYSSKAIINSVKKILEEALSTNNSY